MGGALDFLRAAIDPAIAARSGYLSGQHEGEKEQREIKRQGALDQLKQSLDQSTINENNARADYYKNYGTQRERPDYEKVVDKSTGKVSYVNKHDPSDIRDTPLTEGTKDEKDPVTHISQYDPSTGLVSDVTSSGKRINSRKATAIERLKYEHMPRDGDEPPPMNDAARDKMAQELADSAVRAAGGDATKAMAFMNRPGEYEKAKAAKMTLRHYEEAAARFKRQAGLDRETHDMKPDGSPMTKADLDSAYGKVKGPVAPASGTAGAAGATGATTATPPKPGAVAQLRTAVTDTTKGDIDLGNGGKGDPLAADPRVKAVVDAIKAKRASLADVDQSQRLSPEQKAAVKRLLAAGSRP